VPYLVSSVTHRPLRAVPSVSDLDDLLHRSLSFPSQYLGGANGSATTAGGSPGRRRAIRNLPVTLSIPVTTSFTECSFPVPSLSAVADPPSRECSSPNACASARSFTRT